MCQALASHRVPRRLQVIRCRPLPSEGEPAPHTHHGRVEAERPAFPYAPSDLTRDELDTPCFTSSRPMVRSIGRPRW